MKTPAHEVDEGQEPKARSSLPAPGASTAVQRPSAAPDDRASISASRRARHQSGQEYIQQSRRPSRSSLPPKHSAEYLTASTSPLNGTPSQGASAASILQALPVRETMGRYELTFEIACGGFATVYLARTAGPGGFEKVAAVKRIHPHLARNPEFIEMFLDEARIAARINHPNVCSVFDFGAEHGTHYLAMDYVLGEPLSEVALELKRNPWAAHSPQRHSVAAWVIACAAEGLHAAHEAVGAEGRPLNIVHRDVAPANIFVRYDGHIQMVDFGLANAVGKLHHTATGIAKGRVAYMSPEQFQGQQVDRRTDVWALGVILWELLTGKRLFKREAEAQTMHAVLHEAVEPPSAYDPDIPQELDAIVFKALAKDARRRFQSAADLSQALHAYLRLSDTPVGGHEVSRWMQELFPGRRETKLQLIEEARKLDPIARSEPTPQEGWPGTSELPNAPSTSQFRRASLAPRSRIGWIGWIGSLLTGFVGATAGVWLWQRTNQPPPPPTRESAPSAQVGAPPAAPSAPSSETAPQEKGESTAPSPRERSAPSAEAKASNASGAESDATAWLHLSSPERPVKVFFRGQLLGTTPRNFQLPIGWQRLYIVPEDGTPARSISVYLPRRGAKRLTLTFSSGSPAAANTPGEEPSESL